MPTRPAPPPLPLSPAVAAGAALGLGAGFGAGLAPGMQLVHASGADVPLPTGAGLRAYWREYEGVTRLRASLTRDLSRGLSVVATGENLLDAQRGEPDDVTVVPGRTLSLGARVRF